MHGEKNKKNLDNIHAACIMNRCKMIQQQNSTVALTVTNSSARIDTSSIYLFSRNVFAFDTFFPIADAFQEK